MTDVRPATGDGTAEEPTAVPADGPLDSDRDVDVEGDPAAAAETVPRSHAARNAALAVGAVLVLLVVVLATRKPPQDVQNPLIGRRVPALAGPTIHGGTLDIDQYRGKWVVVNFLASWCTGCIEEHPDLKRFAEEHADTAQIIGVGFDDSRDKLLGFFQVYGGSWPVVVSDGNRIAVDFGVTGVPESFVVRPDGVIVGWNQGVTYDWLNRVIEANGGHQAAVTSAGSTGGAPAAAPTAGETAP